MSCLPVTFVISMSVSLVYVLEGILSALDRITGRARTLEYGNQDVVVGWSSNALVCLCCMATVTMYSIMCSCISFNLVNLTRQM